MGYDIMVWVDRDGDIVSRAYTRSGHDALRSIVNTYEKGDIVQIHYSPPEFVADMPKGLVIGLLTSEGVKRMNGARLH
jgi:ribosomal protein L21E